MSPQYSQDPRFATKGAAKTGQLDTRRWEVGQGVEQRYPDVPHHQGAAPHVGEQVCEGCHAVYADKHWNYDEARYAEMRAKGATTTQCPGCRALADRQYRGELTMLAAPPAEGIDERRQRLFDVEALARARDPMARIAELAVEPGKWHLYTTSARLAERLGKELQKAFGGDLQVDKLKATPYSRVLWVEGPKHAA